VIRMDPAVTPQGVIADAQRKLGLPEGAPLASASGPVGSSRSPPTFISSFYTSTCESLSFTCQVFSNRIQE